MKERKEILFSELSDECEKVLVGVNSNKKEAIIKIFSVMADEIVFLVKRLTALESESNALRHENTKLNFKIEEMKLPSKDHKKSKNRDN